MTIVQPMVAGHFHLAATCAAVSYNTVNQSLTSHSTTTQGAPTLKLASFA